MKLCFIRLICLKQIFQKWSTIIISNFIIKLASFSTFSSHKVAEKPEPSHLYPLNVHESYSKLQLLLLHGYHGLFSLYHDFFLQSSFICARDTTLGLTYTRQVFITELYLKTLRLNILSLFYRLSPGSSRIKDIIHAMH